ncbi:MAG: MerR family transcriptional regulator, partial [Flavobacteriaceae bacterium]
HPPFVLFLPENEIHELGILYLNYLILSHGFRTIFLGQSLQTSSLETLYTYQTDFIFVSYLTVEPNKEEIMPFLAEFYKTLLANKNSKLLLFGPQQIEINTEKLPGQIEMFRSVESFISRYLVEKVFV